MKSVPNQPIQQNPQKNKSHSKSQSEPELEVIENRLSQLLTKSRSDWTEMARLTLDVQQKKLYQQKGFSSFSAWVRQLAVTNNREPSLLWRFVKAAKYFLKLTGSDDLEQVREAAKIAPEALEKLEKVQRQAPTPVFETLKERVFSGDVTVAECRRIEKDYRPPATEVQTNRGRPLKGEEGKLEYLGQWKNSSNFNTFVESSLNEPKIDAELELLTPPLTTTFTRCQLISSIKRSLKADYLWMQECRLENHSPRNWVTHQDVRLQEEGKTVKLDLVGVVRWDLKRSKDLFAVDVITCLNDLSRNDNWEEYLNYSNFFCFACPLHDKELRTAIQKKISRFPTVGILGVNFSAKLNNSLTYPIQVIKFPQYREDNKTSLVYENLYERVLGWSMADLVIGDEFEIEINK